MRAAIVICILGLAAFVSACGNGDNVAPEETPVGTVAAATEEPTGTVATAIPGPITEFDAIGQLTAILREANLNLYTLGCVYSYDFAAGDWSAEDVIEDLPVPTGDSVSWEKGQVVPLDSTYFIVTVRDANSGPTGATIFRRIDGDRRFCLVPKLDERPQT